MKGYSLVKDQCVILGCTQYVFCMLQYAQTSCATYFPAQLDDLAKLLTSHVGIPNGHPKYEKLALQHSRGACVSCMTIKINRLISSLY